ncbi:hypothetical protein E8E12_004677 [Didymella heteroderae]|uniref:Uncharacterized protein n=1 Tax=Didymella heteroderae TaxID=1769908 RepID=A0A9P4X020_9PLEO|nr:hypothetical protein E8E12_004677 [Didymella heteroderae]
MELKKVQDSVGRRVRRVGVAEQIAFQKMRSARRKGVKKTQPFMKLLKDIANVTRTHAAVLKGRVTKLDVLRPRLSIQNSEDASRLSLSRSMDAHPRVGIDAVETDSGSHVPADSTPVDTHEAVVRLPTPSSGASTEDTSEPTIDVLRDRLNELERAQIVDHLQQRSFIRTHTWLPSASTHWCP